MFRALDTSMTSCTCVDFEWFLVQERNIAHASELCEEATAAAVAGKMTVAVAKFQQALFYRPDYAQGHEMRAQACCYQSSASSFVYQTSVWQNWVPYPAETCLVSSISYANVCVVL